MRAPKRLKHIISTKRSVLDNGSAFNSNSPLAQMINDSPALASLGLRFRHGPGKLQPDGLIQSLDRNFPALRKLDIRGSFSIDWESFVGQTSPLYRFFENHPGLRAVTFTWDCSDQSPLTSAAHSMFDRLLPSLQEFSGMQALCVRIVGSPKLSQQIEKLRLIDNSNQPESPPSLNALSQEVSLLPRLREFEYTTQNYDPAHKPLDAECLGKFLLACPSLVLLKIPYFPDKLVSRFCPPQVQI